MNRPLKAIISIIYISIQAQDIIGSWDLISSKGKVPGKTPLLQSYFPVS